MTSGSLRAWNGRCSLLTIVAIHIQQSIGPRTADLDVEIVERKGIGHPDSVCDAVMENVSRALSHAYRERTGTVLHHNCDKAMLVAGRVELQWGGGRVLEPMRLVMGDRATADWNGQHLDVEAIAVDAARRWIRGHLRHVDPDVHVRYQVELKPGSAVLAAQYRREGVPTANDTSAAVGHAPLTETERLVFEAERYLNSRGFKARFPDTGEDVKVMGVKEARTLRLTIAMPLLDRALRSEHDYFQRLEEVQAATLAHLRPRLESLDELTVHFNALDRRGEGLSGIYASVLGVSAESGDSGEVGRGNRVNGLISFCRPGGSEAAAGKNPVGHTGKIYSVLADRLAGRLVGGVPGLDEVTLWLASEIGRPVDQPHVAFALVHLAPGAMLADVADAMESMIAAELAQLPAFCRDVAAEMHTVI
jgi:S-adenosylmethionine synthetase